tara:strand:+ start:977 stop:1540 length:564 start_codon:yes stop_codon:yes gene_type:complete
MAAAAKRRRSRAGRPRGQGERYPSGGLKRARDNGTPETQASRIALAEYVDENGVRCVGDTTKTSTPLDALLANRTITQEQHDAGERFGRWYRCVYGPANGRRPVGGEVPDKVLERTKPKLASAMAALRAHSRAQLDIAVNICAYERFARWVPVRGRLDRHERQVEMLIAGLDVLAQGVDAREDRRAA